ncbi:hypothetical protein C7999DRAFT_14521 [Corynascus novoguineensis]|uniref:Uncharacterized protein n=1 Tax=Corynascus novoguineensis TaxID=1126955 RepID=A0AAN7HQ85_9PEZI|nr:hypothetical protein C7999DRAFT_14521 [Corynascus novoguineensis]
MAYLPVKLIRPSALQLDPAEPCLLEIHISIPLPHRLGSSLPAPPYILNHDDDLPNPPGNRTTVSPEDLQTIHALPLIRHLISQIQSHLFGQPTAAAATTATASGNPDLGGQLLHSWDVSIVPDKQGGFDFAAGWWRDQYGTEAYGPIYAYNEAFDGVEVLHAIKLYLVRGVEEHEALKKLNPRVLRFDIVEEEEEGRAVVFEVKEYTEDSRGRYTIPEAAWLMELSQREARNLAARDSTVEASSE